MTKQRQPVHFDELNIGLGSAIRELRNARGLTQEQLADAADLHRTYVSLVERGRKGVTVGVLFRISTALGTQPDVLIKALSERLRIGRELK
jgi:transcriptional regulator with XRE-family HTH domain